MQEELPSEHSQLLAMEKYDLQSMGFISLFEKITHTHAKRLFTDKRGQLVFIVEEGQAGKAIGKSGMHIRKLQQMFKKRIKVIEFNQDPKEFIKNCIAPLEVDSMTLNEDKLTLSSNDTKTKGILIGRDRQNLKELNEVVKKFFKIEVLVA